MLKYIPIFPGEKKSKGWHLLLLKNQETQDLNIGLNESETRVSLSGGRNAACPHRFWTPNLFTISSSRIFFIKFESETYIGTFLLGTKGGGEKKVKKQMFIPLLSLTGGSNPTLNSVKESHPAELEGIGVDFPQWYLGSDIQCWECNLELACNKPVTHHLGYLPGTLSGPPF